VRRFGEVEKLRIDLAGSAFTPSVIGADTWIMGLR
jgi:hypothetical protein